MPIYEYGCPQCGAEFEKLVDARTVVACPSCENPKVMKRLSLFRASVGARPDGTPSAGGMSGGCCGGGGCGCH